MQQKVLCIRESSGAAKSKLHTGGQSGAGELEGKAVGMFSSPTQGHLSLQVREEPQVLEQRLDWGSRGTLAEDTTSGPSVITWSATCSLE